MNPGWTFIKFTPRGSMTYGANFSEGEGVYFLFPRGWSLSHVYNKGDIPLEGGPYIKLSFFEKCVSVGATAIRGGEL